MTQESESHGEEPLPHRIDRIDDVLLSGIPLSSIRRDLRAGRATRVYRGVYEWPPDGPTADAAPGPDLPRLQAAYLHLGPEATAVLSSALHLHGISGVAGSRPAEFAMPPGLEKRQRDNLSLHFWRIPDDHRTMVEGIHTTAIAPTLADACRLLPRMQAVSCLDSALSLGLITVDQLPRLGTFMSRRPGSVTGRRRLAEARLGAQSPLETRVRLRADDAGLRPDALQVPVKSPSDVVLGYGDMGFRLPAGGWLIVEADGRAVHEQPRAVLHDRHRQNAFLSHGNAHMVRFTWQDTLSAGYIPSVLQPLLNQAGWRPGRRLS